MSGGDFVRNVKQVIDLLRQVAVVAESDETARAARSAAERLLRDVVAASSVVTIPVERGTIRAGGQPAP
jgi:ATP-dependent RNA helicase HelY